MSAAKITSKRFNALWLRPVLVMGTLLLGVAIAWLMLGRDTRRTDQGVPRSNAVDPDFTTARQNEYAGSTSCRECHPNEYRLWTGSHHGMAQRNPEKRLDDAAFAVKGSLSLGSTKILPRKSGDEYEAITANLAGTQECFRVESVIGASPLRQFLVNAGQGRLQALDAAYDPRTQEWFNVFGADIRNAGDWGHWTGRGMNWNSRCAGCHNTRLRKGYHEADDIYRTTMAEASVGCEACHGPLKAHNDWQKQFAGSGRKDPAIPHWSSARVMDNCGFCHARRGELTGDFKPGDLFLDQMRPEIVDTSGTFYPDGQVREEDYEYASFLSSRMNKRGVYCGDCHDPHSARTTLPGNWLCLRCHNGSYTNAPIIEPVMHSHHRVFGYDTNGLVMNSDFSNYREQSVKETGGQCVNCHMPQTTYMQRHRRHDHGFTIPDPLLTKQAGIPNACNRCHQDKDADWALRYCTEWYGARMDRPYRRRALTITAATKNDPGAREGLLDMLATNEIPYWRAVGAGMVGVWGEKPEVREALMRGLSDPEPLVRLECIRALESWASVGSIAQALRHCQTDPVRAVRVAAAWSMRETLDVSSPAGNELLRCLEVNADQPAGQMQEGVFGLSRGDAPAAAQHYYKAVQWDPNLALARHDYAVVLSSLNRSQEAVEQLQAACRLEPTNSDFEYKLGLAWNELGKTEPAIEHLQTAVRLDTANARAWYNLGLAFSSTGRTEEALEALTRAEEAAVADPRIPYARATILARLGALAEARKAALRALEIDSQFEPGHELLRSLR